MIVDDHSRGSEAGVESSPGENLSLRQIARAAVIVFGFGISLTGLVLIVELFNAVYAAVFTDSGSLAQAFEKWRQIVVPAGIEEGHYDKIFPLTTVLVFVTMSVPVLFLSWLATKVIMLGIKVVGVKA